MPERPALPGWPYGLCEDLAAAFLGVSVSLFRREWQAGRMPAPVRVTQGRQVWPRPALEAWLDAKAGIENPSAARAGTGPADEWDRACGIREAAVPQHL